ncbi:nuclear pore glycoprotein p62 isoform X2 [Cloeon dipterum]
MGSFGAAAASAAPASAAGGFSLPAATPATATAAPTSVAGGGFSIDAGKSSLFGGSGLSFGASTLAASAVATSSAPSLSFGGAATATAATATSAPTFGGFSNLSAAAPAASTAPSLAPQPAAAAAPLLSLGNLPKQTTAAASATTTATPLLTSALFGAKTTSTQEQTSTTATPSSTSLTTVPTTVASSNPKLSYSTLESEINKWAYQLEEQENIFIHQATQVNAWDRLLLESGDKITELNSTIETLKVEQQKLDLELDYISSLERELEDSIAPIETAISTMQLADPERQQTYEMAENLDAQTKQMANDLKKIINHLNVINKEQDENNPVVQVGRILNAHMNSLLWIHQTATASQSQMDEASKVIDLLKKELLDHSALLKQ